MTCKRHSYVWIPRTNATFENLQTGELVAFDLGVCRHCGHYKPRLHVWSAGDQVDAELWGMEKFEIRRTEDGR